MIPDTYDQFFELATPDGLAPYPYQRRLAEAHADLVRVETGLGKTEGLVLGWLWRLLNDRSTPRRLVYMLPMRSLVEQTMTRIQDCLGRLDAHRVEPPPHVGRPPRVECVMGGNIGETWFREPEHPWIIVGTQDALLSRALNRGYAMSRFQWPMTFGALNNDAEWIVDEVQLQGIGAVTAAQLQGLRERFDTFGFTRTTLVSATLDTTWFDTPDYSAENRMLVTLSDEDRRMDSVRTILDAEKTLRRVDGADEKRLAETIGRAHRAGTRTLVVVNTVDRSRMLAKQLRRIMSEEVEIVLLHSRFRPEDREKHAKRLTEPVDPQGAGRLVVATQVVEAGIDVSATTLFTDVAPWSSLVQRFGRCNRRGRDSDARIFWIDSGEPDKKNILPYTQEEIAAARAVLIELDGRDVAPSKLPHREIQRGGGLVLRKPELLDLFDTSSDLSGHDVDVSPYIRDGSDFTVSVFWRNEEPSNDDPPRREELCPASLSEMGELIKELRANRHCGDIRIANQFGRDDAWVPLLDDTLRPGLCIWLRSNVGWYDPEVGFCKAHVRVAEVSREAAPKFVAECDTIGGDHESKIGKAVTITKHAKDTYREAVDLVAALNFLDRDAHSVTAAALWHDVGKAHHIFQETMRRNMPAADSGALWAKSIGGRMRHAREGFRHELPGALVYLAEHDGEPGADLVAFLIAAHHGKFRVSAQPLPYEKENGVLQVLGNREGDRVPSVPLLDGQASRETTLTLRPFRVGTDDGAPTWVDRTIALRDDPVYGPFRLAYLELLVRIADWRASARAAEET